MTSTSKVGFGGFAVLLSLLLLGLSPAYAGLAHRYDFATDASDSVGSADGTLYGTATISGGVLSTTNSLGQWTAGAPANGVGLPASTVSGITGAFTIEMWSDINFGGGYTTAFSFSDTTTSNYVLATPARGNSPYASTISVIGGGGPAGEQQASGQYIDNGYHHMLVTFDGTNLTYYQDASTDLGGFNTANGLSASVDATGLNLSTLTAIGINGGAPWPDNSILGDTYDFRIYDNSVNASQVTALYALGADATNAQIAAALTTPANLWYVDADGAWNSPTNWYSGSVPGTNEDVTLGDIITADRTVTLDVSPSVNSLAFNNPLGNGDYFIVDNGGGETLTLTGDARISTNGRHWLRAEVAGTAGLHATGPGEVVLDADNSFTGGLTVQNANLSVVNTDAIPAGNAIVLQDNGDLRFFGDLNGFFHDDSGSPGFGTGTISNSVSVASGSILGVFDGADLTLAAAVTADGILSADNATLTLGSSSTTTFNLADDGVSGSIVGAGNVNLNGAFSVNNASVTDTVAAWTLVNVGSLTETYGAGFSVAGYTESGGIWTNGDYAFNEATGLLSLGDVWAADADGSYSTASNWNNGMTPAANANVLFSPVITENRTVTLDNGGSSVVVNSVTFNNGDGDYFIVPDTTESLTVTSGNVTILSGRHWLRADVAGTNGLNVSGAGELVLDADNSFSGGITIDGTDVSVVHTDAIPAGNNITIQNGSQLQFFGPDSGFFVDDNGSAGYGTGTVDGAITLNTGTVLRVTDGANVTFSGVISGDGHIEVNLNGGGDGGIATFTAPNTYTGTIQTWNSGIIALSGSGTLGVEDGTVANCTFLSNQGQLALDNVAVGNEFIYLDASADANQAKIAGSGNSSIAGNIFASTYGSGVYKITSAAGGTLTLSGTLSAVDDATPSERAYIFGGDGDIHITGRITDSLVDDTGNISGPSTGDNVQVVKRGAGTMTVETNVDSDYWRGNTTVEGGTLKLVATAGSDNELYSPLTTVRAGATLDVSTFSAYDVGVGDALAGGGTIDVGSGELAIYDDNSVTPGDSVGTLHVTGNVSLTNDVTGGSLNYELGNTTTVGGTENDLLAVTGTLTTYGTPTMSLNVNFVEGSIAAGGSSYTLATFASSSVPDVSGLTPQVVDSDGNAMAIRPTLAVSSTATNIKLGVTGNTQTYNWSGATSGTWDKGPSGSNNWTSTDSKFYDLDSVTFGSGPTNTAVAVADNVAPGSMTVNGGASYQFSGSDINAASVTVTGNATASFSNSVGGAVTVASTGTLGGSGTFKNNVTVQSGGKIRIGAAGLATATGLLDNFNSYDNSTVTTIGANAAGDATGGAWQGVFDGTDNARIFDDPAQDDGGTADNMLQVYGAAGAWRGAETNLSDNFSFDRSIKDGDTSTTVFMQFQAKDPGTNDMDSVWGLAEGAEDLNDSSPWNGYAIMGIVGDVGTPNNIHFRIFDGPGGTNSEVTVIGNMAVDTWYNAWFVVNEAAETFDLYTSTGTDAGTLVGTYNFGRATGTSGLQKLGFTELASSGGEDPDSALRIDNVYLAPGVDTTNPLVNGSWGGTVFATETMSVEGDVNLEDGSTVTFDIASSGVNDALDISGNLDVANGFILEVALDGSVAASSLAAGNSWDLFNFATSSGDYDGDLDGFILPSGLASGLSWDTSQLLVDGTISIIGGLVGDYNGDGTVDAADYTVWRDNLGGDGLALQNRDPANTGSISEADYTSWKDNFGATLGAGSGATAELQGVPEPSSIVLLLASIVGCGAFAPRRRS